MVFDFVCLVRSVEEVWLVRSVFCMLLRATGCRGCVSAVIDVEVCVLKGEPHRKRACLCVIFFFGIRNVQRVLYVTAGVSRPFTKSYSHKS